MWKGWWSLVGGLLCASWSWGSQGESPNARHGWRLEISSDTWLCSLFGELNFSLRCSLFFRSFFCFTERVYSCFFDKYALVLSYGSSLPAALASHPWDPSRALSPLRRGGVELSCRRRASPRLLRWDFPAAAAGQGGAVHRPGGPWAWQPQSCPLKARISMHIDDSLVQIVITVQGYIASINIEHGKIVLCCASKLPHIFFGVLFWQCRKGVEGNGWRRFPQRAG